MELLLPRVSHQQTKKDDFCVSLNALLDLKCSVSSRPVPNAKPALGPMLPVPYFCPCIIASAFCLALQCSQCTLSAS